MQAVDVFFKSKQPIKAVYQRVNSLIWSLKWLLKKIITHHKHNPGAPNDNKVQNRLNIAGWTYFGILKVNIGIYLSPQNFLSVRIS